MKIVDDYKAKVRLWAAKPMVIPEPKKPELPRFDSRKFSSHAEMNEWKKEFLLRIAQAAARKSMSHE